MSTRDSERPKKDRIDPLVWLRQELNAADKATEEQLPIEVIERLEALALRLMNTRSDVHVDLHPKATDVLVEMLPSASLTVEFRDRVLGRRRMVHDAMRCERQLPPEANASPGALLLELRRRRGISIDQGAHALGISTAKLKAVESGGNVWLSLPVSRLPHFAAAVAVAWEEFTTLLERAARRYLLAQLEQRLTLSLGRHDSLGTRQAARLDALKTAMAIVRRDNSAAARFFQDVRTVDAAQAGNSL